MVAVLVMVLLAGPGEPDLAGLLEEARRVQQTDLEFWGTLSFRRQVTRERLDADGSVTFRQELDFRITPEAGGFDETLIRIDGRPPTRREIDAHRGAARFGKRYRSAISGRGDGSVDRPYDFSGFLRRPGYAYRGVEMVGGRACHRLDFPAREPSGGTRDERLWAATAGSLWIDTKGLHLVRAETRTVRSVPVMIRLGKVVRVEIRLEARPFRGHWIPRSIDVRTVIKVAGFPVRKRNIFSYSEHSVPK